VSWRYLMDVLVIFDGCHGDIGSVTWKYFRNVVKIFDRCNKGIL